MRYIKTNIKQLEGQQFQMKVVEGSSNKYPKGTILDANAVSDDIKTTSDSINGRLNKLESKSNVALIVETKDDLDTLDKSVLHDDDQVVVLKDEDSSNTANDYLTIYKYTKQTDQFTKQSSNGPYKVDKRVLTHLVGLNLHSNTTYDFSGISYSSDITYSIILDLQDKAGDQIVVYLRTDDNYLPGILTVPFMAFDASLLTEDNIILPEAADAGHYNYYKYTLTLSGSLPNCRWLCECKKYN